MLDVILNVLSPLVVALGMLCIWGSIIYGMINSKEVRSMYGITFKQSPEFPIIVSTSIVSFLVVLSFSLLVIVPWQVVIVIDLLLLLPGIGFVWYWALFQVFMHGDIEIKMRKPPPVILSEEEKLEIEEEKEKEKEKDISNVGEAVIEVPVGTSVEIPPVFTIEED